MSDSAQPAASTFTGAEVAELLRSHRYRFNDERELQDGIELALRATGVAYEREVRLEATSRIDFMVKDVGIEVKIAHSATALLRQLHRYAQIPAIRELVVVTRRLHHAQLPDTLGGKPLHVVALLAGLQ